MQADPKWTLPLHKTQNLVTGNHNSSQPRMPALQTGSASPPTPTSPTGGVCPGSTWPLRLGRPHLTAYKHSGWTWTHQDRGSTPSWASYLNTVYSPVQQELRRKPIMAHTEGTH